MTKKYSCPIPNCTYSWFDEIGWQEWYFDHLKLNHTAEEVVNSLKETIEKKLYQK